MNFDKLFLKRETEKLSRQRNSVEKRSAVIEKGRPVFQKYGIKRAVLFGSITEGRATEKSDADILVMPLDKKLFWEFSRDLRDAIGMPLDLYTGDDDSVIVNKILSRGETIYEE